MLARFRPAPAPPPRPRPAQDRKARHLRPDRGGALPGLGHALVPVAARRPGVRGPLPAGLVRAGRTCDAPARVPWLCRRGARQAGTLSAGGTARLLASGEIADALIVLQAGRASHGYSPQTFTHSA